MADRCTAPDCGSPSFIGPERKDEGHAMVEGHPMHFSCAYRERNRRLGLHDAPNSRLQDADAVEVGARTESLGPPPDKVMGLPSVGDEPDD